MSAAGGLPVPWSPAGSVNTTVRGFKQSGSALGVPAGVAVGVDVGVPVGVAVAVAAGVAVAVAVAVAVGVGVAEGASETHWGNLKLPIRVCQGAPSSGTVWAGKYSFTYQKVQPSLGSTVRAL